MARQYTSPILLPAAPSTGLHAATKQYVDDGDSATAAAAAPLVHTHTEANVTSLVSDLAGKQPLDSDLTTIAALTPGAGNVMAADGSGWVSKSYTALKTSLALTEADVSGLTTDLAALARTVTTITHASSVTPDALSGNAVAYVWTMTGSATIVAPINPVQMQIIRVAFLASGGAWVLTFSGFVGSTDFSTAAITMTSGKWLTMSFQYLSAIGWQIVGRVTSL